MPDPIILVSTVCVTVTDRVRNACFKSLNKTLTTAGEANTTTTGAPHITNGTCPLTKTDLKNGVANQRRISYEQEYNIAMQNREREWKDRTDSQSRMFLSKPSRRWPNNEIPYLLG